MPKSFKSAYGRLWRARNPNYYRDYYAKKRNDPTYRAMKNRSAKWARRKAKYGVTRDQYEAMLTTQNGRCIICGGDFGRDLRVDHDHETGKVRALLCNGCNAGLGMFRDSVSSLQSAVTYLIGHKE